MTKFGVCFDGCDYDDCDQVEAETAAKAASAFYCDMVMHGDERADCVARLVVVHPDGPKVDPSAVWREDEDGVFSIFETRVRSIDVAVKPA